MTSMCGGRERLGDMGHRLKKGIVFGRGLPHKHYTRGLAGPPDVLRSTRHVERSIGAQELELGSGISAAGKWARDGTSLRVFSAFSAGV
jgi:hypothetical protein